MCGYFFIGFIDFMLPGKKLTGFTGLFSPYDFKVNDYIIERVISKMNEGNSIKEIDRTNLTIQTKFRLDEKSKIENYFCQEINQRKSCSKKLSKYVGVPEGIASESFTLIFSLTTGIV